MYVGVAENNINTIYLGGSDRVLNEPLILKSINGGNSWESVFQVSNNANIITGWEGSGGDKAWSWSESVFGLTVAPNNANKVLFGNYSNVQATADGGTIWRQAYVDVNDQHPAGATTPKKQSYKMTVLAGIE